MERRSLPGGAGPTGAAPRLPRVRGCVPLPGLRSRDRRAPGPRSAPQELQISFAFAHFEQIKQRKLHIEC